MEATSIPNLVDRVLKRAVSIQQVAAPTFAERERALFVMDWLEAEGLADLSLDEVGNVYARLPGSGQAPALVVSAHLDTVFPANTDLTLRRERGKIYGPGIGDNSMGVAGLFGLLWMLRPDSGAPPRSRLPGDIWLVANVGEEGLGDLGGMRAVVNRFQDQVSAYLILEGMALGQVYHRALGVQRFRITARTTGGHSWVDYGKPSAIHELAGLVVALAAIPQPKSPRTTLNVGVISGGTSVNTIASEAHLELDLRSEGGRALGSLTRKVTDLVKAFDRPGIELEMSPIGNRPAGNLAVNHPLVRLAQDCLKSQGIQPNLNIGSTDANIPLSLGLPAVCIGLTTGSGAHTIQEQIDTEPLHLGLAQLACLVQGVFSMR